MVGTGVASRVSLPLLLLQTVAIDPEYSKRRKNMFVTGGSKGLLVMHEDKGWGLGLLQGTKQRTVSARSWGCARQHVPSTPFLAH